ncbi:selenide, water dikinase SelD [Campylobacter hyointestinalis]|uniref:selenide, water dikinase SelD n=1 Tax=Campylobacter hyointestinalis TaxID=198 RepID=UPI000DCDCD9E|nr:selenide, water dikinase SelD [Campylobacter hyointestinalis]RAZ24654.1 selenide, water dikinase SelD [Campylobacter hyointestinalis subsp. lawsonii]RAZ39022.1 selenide, water dikinase SelD [Campylobacter hyointestinalis subsp. lawsonii]
MKQLVYNNKNLTKFIKASGCAAKLDPLGLTQSIGDIIGCDPRLISSLTSNEDAGVFKLDADTAIVQTLDFITPVVDDPFLYGQIAAANSLSDIFAMGAKAITAMNIVGFDSCHFSGDILKEIMLGGKNKISECGAVLVGGHSIETVENIYGLSVTGIVNPNDFWANNTAKLGDLLILTKPLGSGVLSTALKGGFLSIDETYEVVNVMAQLNFYALKALEDIKVNAATDVTGFGFLGHLSEMLRDDICFDIYQNLVPILNSARKYADLGLIPEGSHKNAKFISKFCQTSPDILLCDAQTSGGLILSIAEKDAYRALTNLKNAGYEKAEIIGVVTKEKEYKINLI